MIKKYNICMRLMIALCISLFACNIMAKADETAIKSHVSYLADDKMEGRLIGTDGCKQAAEYIKQYFQNIGLKAFSGNYFQAFSHTSGGEIGKNSELSINTLLARPGLPREEWKKIKKKLPVNTDWAMLPFSSEGAFQDMQIVFAGFGVTNPDLGYDDYAGIDVKGKAVLVIADSTLMGGSNYNFLNGNSSVMEKISNATAHNAAAVIVVKRQSDSANLFYENKLMGAMKFGLPVIQITRTAAGKLFPKGKFLIDYEKNINASQKPQSFILPEITINLKLELTATKQELMNVVGYVEGSDSKLKNEYIVVGGHYDHIGHGEVGSTYRGKDKPVFNGADDNASGTAAMMELASIVAKNPLKRSVIFIAFTGEEEGLLGSSHFVKNSPVDIKNIVAMLNFDMVGRLRNKELTMLGVGTSNVFAPMIEKYATEFGLKINEMSDGFTPSDQTSFYASGVPSLMFFTGLHSDYHAPGDDADKINYAGMNEVINFANAILKDVANESTKPDYNEKTLDKMKQQMRENSAKMTGHGGDAVFFGIVPDFGENPQGMLISGTSDESPARKAGLLRGDIITEFAGKPIKNLYDLTYALRASKPGDKVTVKYLRDGKEAKTECTLEKR